jgi:hypothetical protein
MLLKSTRPGRGWMNQQTFTPLIDVQGLRHDCNPSVAALRLYSHPRNAYPNRAGIHHSHHRNRQFVERREPTPWSRTKANQEQGQNLSASSGVALEPEGQSFSRLNCTELYRAPPPLCLTRFKFSVLDAHFDSVHPRSLRDHRVHEPDVSAANIQCVSREGRFQCQWISGVLFLRHAGREIQLARWEAYGPVTMPANTSIV